MSAEKYANLDAETYNDNTNITINSSNTLTTTSNNNDNNNTTTTNTHLSKTSQPIPQPNLMQPGISTHSGLIPFQPGMMHPNMIHQKESLVKPGMMFQPGIIQPGFIINTQPTMEPGITPVMIGQPGIIIYHNQAYMSVKDPHTELEHAKTAIILQETDLMEIVTNCEPENKYNIFIQDEMNNTKFLFKCKEESKWFQRNCCDSNHREFNMKIKHVPHQLCLNEDYSKSIMQINKHFNCGVFCMCRPEIVVKHCEQQTLIGKIHIPFSYNNPLLVVTDNKAVVKYEITVNCCECGFMWRSCSCGKGKGITFGIYVKGQDRKGQPVGTIQKKVNGVQAILAEGDCFVIEFPENANKEDKMLLIVATIVINYMYYDNGGTIGKTHLPFRRKRRDGFGKLLY